MAKRSKAALAKDRKYTSDESWEKAYSKKRKSAKTGYRSTSK